MGALIIILSSNCFVEISLQFCGYVEVVSPGSHQVCMFLMQKREKLMWMAGQCGIRLCGIDLYFFITMFITLELKLQVGKAVR